MTRVLVVDDERFFREAIREALEGAGLPCATAEDGEGALAAVAEGGVGAVVLDIALAGPTGIEVLRALRAAHPAVRVVVVSAHTHQEEVLEALRLHACDYLAKPLHDEELVLTVRRALASFELETRYASLQRRLALLDARLAELGERARDALPAERGDRVAEGVARAAADVLIAAKTSLLRLSEDGVLRVAAATGRKLDVGEMDPVRMGEGIAGRAVARGETLLVDDLASDGRFAGRAPSPRYESRALAVAPLMGIAGPLGALCATDRPDGAVFGEDDAALLRILAREAAGLLEEPAAPVAPPEAGWDGDPTLRFGPDPEPTRAERDVELSRRICDALTREVEPVRVLRAAVAAIGESLPAAPVAVHLLDNATGALRREAQWEGDGPGDRDGLPRTAGLTGAVLQTGCLVATDRPERDPRFDPASDTPAAGGPRPLLCVPLKLRDKTLGVLRAFPEPGAPGIARSGEVIAAAMSAAVRNVLLYRSLLESIEDLARARREGPSPEPR